MRALYLDNYRGFRNQTINFKAVNFFVGENSSGKTSILVALKLMSSSELLFKSGFVVSDLPYVSYADYISRGSSKKGFTIGGQYSGKGKDFKFFRFSQKDGIPYIQGIIYSIGDAIIHIDIGREIKYCVFKDLALDSFSKITTFCMSRLDLGADDMEDGKSGVVNLPPAMKNGLGVGIIQQVINVEYLEGVGEANSDLQAAALTVPHCKWIAPIRAKPQRIYSEYSHEYTSDGVHIPYVLKDMLKSKVKRDLKVSDLIQKFGKYSGLFEALSFKLYGKEAGAPFEITVAHGGISTTINNVGYGVSQILPILVEAGKMKSGRLITIQQPEVHLHPKAQAALGQFIFEVSQDGPQFVIETHSDFIIDRFRLSQNSSEDAVSSQVIFLSRHDSGVNVSHLEISSSGSYPDDQPPEFRDFFLQEELSLIRI